MKRRVGSHNTLVITLPLTKHRTAPQCCLQHMQHPWLARNRDTNSSSSPKHNDDTINPHAMTHSFVFFDDPFCEDGWGGCGSGCEDGRPRQESSCSPNSAISTTRPLHKTATVRQSDQLVRQSRTNPSIPTYHFAHSTVVGKSSSA